MNEQRAKLLGETDPKKLLWKLSIPAIFGMVVNALYNLIDAIFVGQGVGITALGGVGIVYPIQMITFAIGVGLGVGSASIFSRAFGKGDKEKMSQSVNTTIFWVVLLGAIMMISTYLFSTPLLKFFGATDKNFDYASKYLNIILISSIPVSISMVFNNLLRGEGNNLIAMISMIIGSLLNIILDPIFIFVLDMGVEGAAYATMISQIVQFSFVFIYIIFSSATAVKIHLNKIFRPNIELTKELFKISTASFVRNVLGAFLIIYVNRMLIHMTTDATIYQSINISVNRIIMFLFLPAFGFIQGLAPIIGYNYGAQKYDRVQTAMRYCNRIMLYYMIACFVVIMSMSEILMGMFSSDPVFLKDASAALRIIALSFPIISYQIVMSSVFQAIGKSGLAIFISLLRQFILFIPISLVLGLNYGLILFVISYPIADFISSIIGIILYHKEKSDLTKLELQNNNIEGV